jgi:predicted nucleic acid-binding protein
MSRGIDIGMADSLIAGICLVRGATLLTRNRRHYDRIPGLMLAEM